MNRKDNRPYCFLDFDGTLVSNEIRLYEFFLKNLPPNYKHILTKEEFWGLKKMGIHEVDWLNDKCNLDINKDKWNKEKKRVIEYDEYLSLDTKFNFTDNVLTKLREQYIIILISRRDRIEGLFNELKQMNLINYFNNIEVLSHNDETKADRISENYDFQRKGSILAGDTEDDIEAGISLSICTYFVLSGIRGKWIVNMDEKFRNVNIIADIRGLLGDKI